MKRFIVVVASCFLMACALVVFAPSVGAHASASGTFSGVVVNGTHRNAPVANQKVTLQRSVNGTSEDIATTVTGQDGRFRFSNVTGNASDTFAVYTQFQGGMFPSDTANLGSDGATSLTLKVYDTTNDDANLRVAVATLLVRQPRPVNGLIGIGAVISIENTGKTAFVGTPTGDASKPMRLLRFATPPNASDLSLGLGFSGAQIITTDKGFGATATVPPGTTDFAYSIDIPYTGTTGDFSYKAVYPTARVVVLVPPDMFVNGGDFQAQGLIDSLGSRYQVFTVASAAAGKQVSLRLTGLPEAGERNNLDARALTIFAAILALLALLALALYVRRGNIASALRLIPSPSLATGVLASAEAGAAAEDTSDVRERLLRELLELERLHATGKISESALRQRDREIRHRLRELLAVEQTSIVSASGAGASGVEGVQPEADGHKEATPEQSSGGRR